jgi:prolyl oligopeptidase
VSYPTTRRADQVDDYHGTPVADPYRWLEDLDSAETAAWVEAQNAVTAAYLAGIASRGAIRERLRRIWSHERYGVPVSKGSRCFYTHNSGLQNQSVLYVDEADAAAPRVLLDPNALADDGTVALADAAVSEDGQRLAYSLSAAGSDWNVIRVRDVASGRDLDDVLEWVKFSELSWMPDGRAFFYSRYDAPVGGALTEANYFHKLYCHRVGTSQADDVLVYHRPDQKEWGFAGEVTDSGEYLIISVWQGTERRNRIYYQRLVNGPDPVPAIGGTVELLDAFDARYVFLGNDGPLFWFFTDRDAPRGRVVAVDTRNPSPGAWTTVIPETDDTIQSVDLIGEHFVVSYLHDATSRVRLFDLSGRLVRELPLPGLGTATGFSGERHSVEMFYSFESFATPATIYRYDFASGQTEVFRAPALDIDPSDYVVRQVFCASPDGTRVPMFVAHRRDVVPDAATPTLLYGYGGFNISLTPSFRVFNLVWMEMGGVYVLANLRGGGEYGHAWYEAGTRLRKQNVFDDFIAAAEWLTGNGLTSPARLAISGGSNGGLLVGAAMTQRPDLFRAVLAAVGVFDMLRFHRFTIGWAWVSDFGSSDQADEFRALHAYSPLHNLVPGTAYPATLITTGDHDDRVVPSHSFKFAAALQAAQGGGAPALIRIETRAGHGAGKPLSKLIDEAADGLAFLAHSLGLDGQFPSA